MRRIDKPAASDDNGREITGMNGYERYLGMLQGRPVDFLPRTPILMQFAAEYIGSNYGAFASDHRVLVRANLESARDFGIDQVSAISDPYRETQGFGGRVEYVTDGVPRCLPPLREAKDLSLLARPDPLTSERMLDRVEAIRAYKAQGEARYSILGWVEGPAAEAADLRGVSEFLIDLLDDEAFAGELMDLCVDAGIAFARAQVQAGADTIGIGDAIASQVSPRLYERLILPREERLVAGIRAAGAAVKLHICGNITHLLPGIASLKPDVVDVDHMVSLAAVRETLGPGVAITGNLDPVADIRYGTPERIREAVLRAYETVGNPYLVNAGCEIPPGTPHHNLRALCEPTPFRR
jgi:MtaA/CmuA family methyltransferase